MVAKVATAGAVAFFAAGLWFALLEFGVTAPTEPSYEGLDGPESVARFFEWLDDREPQATLVVAVSVAAFVCLMLVAREAALRLGGKDTDLGARVIGLASGLWIAGNLVDVGGRVAARGLAEDELAVAEAINFTVANIDEAFLVAAFALLAVGFLAFGAAARRASLSNWSVVSFLLAVVCVGLAIGYVIDNGTLELVLLAAGGAILMPIWLLMSRGQLDPGAAAASP